MHAVILILISFGTLRKSRRQRQRLTTVIIYIKENYPIILYDLLRALWATSIGEPRKLLSTERNMYGERNLVLKSTPRHTDENECLHPTKPIESKHINNNNSARNSQSREWFLLALILCGMFSVNREANFRFFFATVNVFKCKSIFLPFVRRLWKVSLSSLCPISLLPFVPLEKQISDANE